MTSSAEEGAIVTDRVPGMRDMILQEYQWGRKLSFAEEKHLAASLDVSWLDEQIEREEGRTSKGVRFMIAMALVALIALPARMFAGVDATYPVMLLAVTTGALWGAFGVYTLFTWRRRLFVYRLLRMLGASTFRHRAETTG